jgi:hypothetical protein
MDNAVHRSIAIARVDKIKMNKNNFTAAFSRRQFEVNRLANPHCQSLNRRRNLF